MQPLLDIDDETAVYISQTRRQFEDLRQVAAQLAGFLVLNASGANTASPDHPMLNSAAELYRKAFDSVRTTRPGARASSHHGCLMGAGVELGAALAAARKGIEIDPVLIPLRGAYRHLQDAARALPGFEMVSFQHACCAVAPSLQRTQAPQRTQP